MKIYLLHLFTGLLFIAFNNTVVLGQTNSCLVEMNSLKGQYTGECKNGFAHGKGTASGQQKYAGIFKDGYPEGIGIYNYDDSTFFTGNFQKGLREGKGEMHHLRNGKDSVIKGYWSADQYRGKKYVTYVYNTNQIFDLIEILPSQQAGNTISFQVSTTSGAPDGTISTSTGSGYVLTVSDVRSLDQTFINKLSDFASANKYYVTYQINSFPVHLFITFSNGRMMEMDLYKAAKWMVRLYVNK